MIIKKVCLYGVTLKDSFQEYGISRKRYAVFCIFGHKCSACQEKQMMWRNMKKPSPAGKGDHEVVDEEIIFCADEKAISSSVTRKLVPPSPLEKAIFSSS